jgi:uncharacterized SAM-binding protein YcdF (DUF218 family)
MNALVGEFGLSSWKAIAAALLLPPVPFLLLALWGGLLLWTRRGVGWLLMAASLLALWLSACAGFGQVLSQVLLSPPQALSAARIDALRRESHANHDVAIIVLGGGREVLAPEYGLGSLTPEALERLRFGVWLGRETGIPVGFSGGNGFGRTDGASEAQIAARIAANDFGRPLRWSEEESRDTRENAGRTVALLRPTAVRKIVLVTHGWHMPRALRAFGAAARGRYEIVAAPMGLAPRVERPVLRWLPSAPGFVYVHHVLHEALGLAMGS